jgi:RNA polymerase sigma-70 factor (ECF subfamily)
VTDPELIASARQGNREAFGTLVERYAPQVRRLTRTILGTTTDADDAAQETFLSAWKALDRFDPAQPLGPWLNRIGLNAARDLRRRQRVRSTERLPETLVSPAPSPEQSAGQRLLRERLDAGLAALPERQRIALVLFDVEGYSHAEVAAQLDIPEGTARSEVFHARRRMRATLGPWQEESR